MNERLLEDIVADREPPRVDSEQIRDRFIDAGRAYVAHADDPTIEQVDVLVQHFADRDSDEITEEALALLWTLANILQWMLDDLPLQGQTTDPAWLRQQLELWSDMWGAEEKPDESH